MKGILFKPWKIQFIAEHPDMEIQTRRLGGLKEINQEPDRWLKAIPIPKERLLYTPFKGLWQFSDAHNNIKLAKPRYQIGETVYLKEAYSTHPLHYIDGYELQDGEGQWHNPMFMPASLARHFLKITKVEAERAQEITEEDAKAEGVKLLGYTTQFGRLLGKDTYKWSFEQTWNSINPKYPWESNPWVFKYSFKEAELELA